MRCLSFSCRAAIAAAAAFAWAVAPARAVDLFASGLNHPVVGSTSLTDDGWHHGGATTTSPIWSFTVEPIPGDLDGDGVVDTTDLLTMLSAWGPCPGDCPPACVGDVDGDCEVGTQDLLTLLANWG